MRCVIETCKAMKFEMALMEIETEQLVIPDTQYSVWVSMGSAEFARIVRDLSQIGESSNVSCERSLVSGCFFSFDLCFKGRSGILDIWGHGCC